MHIITDAWYNYYTVANKALLEQYDKEKVDGAATTSCLKRRL
jgi:hypothetical protein